ncbi:bifunctional adenosylcobinamide kinase/adenosylcobinamide-phosphate guanylyltransferase [Natranaerobius thermophilus]|uniref:Adenosylcobinamide kinase n=1 Tax=Natranaerobius thermophilus (strain ATCC BAA-1301 / DSM 18059 / JW/NM-WN-LF) TaxID=457570 RepID=B2A0G1_NATTJ|nr:bifunctional adenosylcobinamide kinase/adenosylcobinamide-phosphate guanylyltransferase [Natranaerobius thermophilus]ACB84522.1 Adenosylcobinamide-phosphate guanylyltransferase [Natranaerobius thermophilus JW/NM-WN-LF]
MGKLVLITGGSASGKSYYAEQLASQLESKHSELDGVIYVATSRVEDQEMSQRVLKHKNRRPEHWDTVVAPKLNWEDINQIVQKNQIVLIDSISMYLSNNLLDFIGSNDPDNLDASCMEKFIYQQKAQMDELCNLFLQGTATVITVSDEVGWGLVPAHKMGRLYRDLVGRMNQILAQKAQEVSLVVSGIPTRIK